MSFPFTLPGVDADLLARLHAELEKQPNFKKRKTIMDAEVFGSIDHPANKMPERCILRAEIKPAVAAPSKFSEGEYEILKAALSKRVEVMDDILTTAEALKTEILTKPSKRGRKPGSNALKELERLYSGDHETGGDLIEKRPMTRSERASHAAQQRWRKSGCKDQRSKVDGTGAAKEQLFGPSSTKQREGLTASETCIVPYSAESSVCVITLPELKMITPFRQNVAEQERQHGFFNDKDNFSMAVAVSNVRVDKDVGGAASDEAALVNACRLQAPRAALEQVVGSSRQSITRKQRNFAALNVLMRRARAVMSITSLAEAIRAQYPDSFKSLLHVSADKHDEMQIRLAVREAVEACEADEDASMSRWRWARRGATQHPVWTAGVCAGQASPGRSLRGRSVQIQRFQRQGSICGRLPQFTDDCETHPANNR